MFALQLFHVYYTCLWYGHVHVSVNIVGNNGLVATKFMSTNLAALQFTRQLPFFFFFIFLPSTTQTWWSYELVKLVTQGTSNSIKSPASG
jgi:hypothetical protein